jgi:hypothetical protein
MKRRASGRAVPFSSSNQRDTYRESFSLLSNSRIARMLSSIVRRFGRYITRPSFLSTTKGRFLPANTRYYVFLWTACRCIQRAVCFWLTLRREKVAEPCFSVDAAAKTRAQALAASSGRGTRRRKVRHFPAEAALLTREQVIPISGLGLPQGKWAMRGSNPRPHGCDPCALAN